MYRINHKAVMLVFFFQIIAGGIWFVSTPTAFLGRSLEEIVVPVSVATVLIFVFSILICLYFTAWLLVKTSNGSRFKQFRVVFGVWCFLVLPNHVFVMMQVDISDVDRLYLMSYSAFNCLITALILPVWSSSRSIFKD